MWHSISGTGRIFFVSGVLALAGLHGPTSVQAQPLDELAIDAADTQLGVLASLPAGVRQLAEAQRGRLTGEPTPQGTTVTLRVGSGCTYSSVQAAINAASSSAATTTVIRLRTQTFTEAIQIGSKNIDIIGGHANCTTTTPDNTSAIRNPSGNAASTILFNPGTGGGTNERTLRLTNLGVWGGDGASISPGGGITVLPIGAARAHLELHSSVIFNNDGLRGGGIALLQQGSALGGSLFMVNTSIRNNDVTGGNPHGGGLYCSGDGYSILKIGGEVRANTAGIEGGSSGRGGGIYLDDGCQMGWFAQGPEYGQARLFENTANGSGGGLFARNNAQVLFYGQHLFNNKSDQPLRIESNRARGSSTSYGGGIRASSANVKLHGTWLRLNRAEQADGPIGLGGALSADNSQIEVLPTVGSTACHDRRLCSLIEGNVAEGRAGIIYATFSSNVLIERAWMANNSDTFGSTGGNVMLSNSATVRIVSSVMTAAGPSRAFRISSNSTLELLYSTLANHSSTHAPFLLLDNNPSVFVRGSILHEAPGMALASDQSDSGAFVDTDCNLWSDDSLANLDAGGVHTRNLMSSDPGFLGPDDFRLREGSPAIDYCNSQTFGFGAPPEFDIIGRPRGVWTTPGILGDSPMHGPFDLGAFEMPVDRLFHSRFEGTPGPL